MLLYAISLCSELICNDRPLYLRFEGRSYFPAFRYYPQSAFFPGAPDTRCDYKQMLARPEFQDREGNYMLWAPVSTAPTRSCRRTASASRRARSCCCCPEPAPPRSVSTRTSASSGEGTEQPRFSAGRRRRWSACGSTRSSVCPEDCGRGCRHDSPASPIASASWECFRQDGKDGDPILLSLSTFARASDRPRPLVKVTLRERTDGTSRQKSLTFDGDRTVVKGDAEFWARIPDETRKTLDKALAEVFVEKSIDPFLVDLGELGSYEARFARDTVRYPFRPISGHLLGLDDTGRDVFARLLYGLRISMTFGLVLVVCSLVFGIVFGAVQGYFGGWADLGGQRFTEVWGALPFLYVMILLGNVYGRSFGLLIFCYALFNWIGTSYYMRAEMLRLRKQPLRGGGALPGTPLPPDHVPARPAKRADPSDHALSLLAGRRHQLPGGAGLPWLRPAAANPQLGGASQPGPGLSLGVVADPLPGPGPLHGDAPRRPSSARASAPPSTPAARGRMQ